jgi:23S rRNA (cytidine1920-2'-O)/16S rRNA (cytidine1409-2'-O)-methyltransferase
VQVNGIPCTKCGYPVKPEDHIACDDSPLTRFLSRGGLKLEHALHHFSASPKGCICVDIGSSTGGFTHCLLQNGAQKVYAVDSGKDQLHPQLRSDPRVVVMEQVNARYLTVEEVEPADLVVMDVSFISQRLLYPAVKSILKPDGLFLSLIKPQFEVGRGKIGSGGIVRREKDRLACIEELKKAALACGLHMEQTTLSPITGGDGNTEYLALFRHQNPQPKERSESL